MDYPSLVAGALDAALPTLVVIPLPVSICEFIVNKSCFESLLLWMLISVATGSSSVLTMVFSSFDVTRSLDSTGTRLVD